METYAPSDDTYLLADSVSRFRDLSVLEIGIGGGVITEELVRTNRYVVGTDISRNAVRQVRDKLEKKSLLGRVDLILADGATTFIKEAFDLIIFNPPYLPSESIRDRAVDGGDDGIGVLVQWLEEVSSSLKREGEVLFVLSSLSNLDRVQRSLTGKYDLQVIVRKRLFFEELLVVKAVSERRDILK